MFLPPPIFSFFFFNDTATTEIYTLSLHDALPICAAWIWKRKSPTSRKPKGSTIRIGLKRSTFPKDRKSTRLNSSHVRISYAVFCLKKKKQKSDQCTTLSSSS